MFYPFYNSGMCFFPEKMMEAYKGEIFSGEGKILFIYFFGIMGIMMFNWNWPPAAPLKVMACWFPITLAVTCIRLSHITGLTLPGMIELPGCRLGSDTS